MLDSDLPRWYPGDARGNPLADYRVDYHGDGHVVRLRGPRHVLDHIRCLAPEYSPHADSAGHREGWTHCLVAHGTVRDDVLRLCDLLRRVVCLPCGSGVEAAVALDWYKLADDSVDPHEWPNTRVGDLVNLGKYRYRFDQVKLRAVGGELTRHLCRIVDQHPAFRRASVMVDVPGHDASRTSFGSRLCRSVAHQRDVRFVKVASRVPFRPEAKNLTPANRRKSLDGQFRIDVSLRGLAVLIIDDVYRSGGSVDETARAARAAGATHVMALCATRTMRA